MKDYAGTIVDNSQEGILQGMYDFALGKIKPNNSDFKEYNEKALDEFNKIIKM